MSYEDERKFLHDIANPLSIVHGNLKIAIRKIDAAEQQNQQLAEILERVNKALDACDKMVKQVSDRRQELMEQQSQAAG